MKECWHVPTARFNVLPVPVGHHIAEHSIYAVPEVSASAFFPSTYSCASYCSPITQDSPYHMMLFPPSIDWNDANHYTIIWFA